MAITIGFYFGVWVKKAPMLAWGMNSPVID
jgi:hypothetical protein